MERVIISGISRGIGFELIKLFSKESIEVIGLSRNLEPLKQLNLPENVKLLEFDLTKEESFQTLGALLKEGGMYQTGLIHNAGSLVNKAFEEISSEEFLRVYQVNVLGQARLTQTVLPYMKINSHVVNISSMGGIQGSMKFPGLAAYSSAKGASITLNELLAEEYKERQIAFNSLALGAVQTEMLEEAFPGYKAPTSALEMAHYIKEFTMNSNRYYNGKTLQVSSTTP
ncbi:MAG: SDR family NAD(P)-dependent oxidoreductase [Flavobacteriaceae bacterium]